MINIKKDEDVKVDGDVKAYNVNVDDDVKAEALGGAKVENDHDFKYDWGRFEYKNGESIFLHLSTPIPT